MANPSISRLGHVGVHCHDLPKQKRFYQEVLGLQVTDEDPAMGMVFMSARPEEEHHEFLLCGGRNVEDRDAFLLQQVSFRCDKLDDVIGFYRRLKQHGVQFDMVVSHGNAIGVYFRDPEGNRLEVYCATGLTARQPYLQAVDLDRPPDEIMRQVEESVRRYGQQGYVDAAMLEQQDIRPQD
ncbi:MAG: VOC family protein [Chloroflexota bacterium]|nr:VOC family protein [Chloroflexota bacterium]